METHEFDTVISAVGIVANTEGLGLEALGAKLDRSFVVTDEYCRSGRRRRFSSSATRRTARGLAHKASHEA